MVTDVFISESEHTMNGYDLVAQILDHPNGGVAGLIRLSEGQETEWLEFKAALYPKDGKFEQGEREDDYRWHVAKAVIALANSVGGAVILGIDDNAQAIGLSASDPENIIEQRGRETFNRDVIQRSLICTSWKTGREGTISLDSSSLHLFISIFKVKTPAFRRVDFICSPETGRVAEYISTDLRGYNGLSVWEPHSLQD